MADGEQISGVKESEKNNGGKTIGGSLRPDGTMRKTLKVRPGFIPAEEVKKYDVRERMKQRQKEAEKTKNESNRNPGSRPNRQFSAINNILQSGSAVRQAKSSSPPPVKASMKGTEEERAHDDIDSLVDNIDKLRLDKDGSKKSVETKKKSSSPIEAENKTPTPEVKPRKYIPPSRRKK